MSRKKTDFASSGDARSVTPPPAQRRATLPALAALSLTGLCAFPLYAAHAQQKVTPVRSTGQAKSNALGGSPNAAPASPVQVLTQRNDNTRAGVNANETILYPPGGTAPASVPAGAPATYGLVSQTTFGKLFTRALDGPCYAQPLYYQNLALRDPVNPRVTSTHNVVFVATNNNSVYAFDADSNTGSNTAALWHINFNRPGGNAVPTSGSDITDILGLPQGDIQPLVGIVGTPVINDANKTLYVVVRTTEGPRYVHRLHAINITTGQEQFYSPQLIGQTQDRFGIVSPVVVPGNGDDADGNGNVFFDLLNENQRPALTLVNGAVYVAYGSFDSAPPYHGWLFSFDAATLNPLGVFNTSPNAVSDFTFGNAAVSGGIDMSGSGPASDGTSLFLSTGEGIFNANDGGTEYGESILKLGLTPTVALPAPYLPQFPVQDTFTPFNILDLTDADTDLGTGGVALFDTAAGKFLATAGQEGRIYLLNRSALGGLGDGADTGAVTTIPNAVGPVNGAPAVYTAVNGATSTTNVYFHGTGDVLKAFPVVGGTLSATPTSANIIYDYPGAMPVVSAKGNSNGIVWEVESHAIPFPTPLGGGTQDQNPSAILHAYDATTLTEIYSSGAAGSGGTSIGDYVKFTMPTVANGKVFVTAGTPTQFDPGGTTRYPTGQLVVFGPTIKAPATQGVHYVLSGPVGFAALSTNFNPGIAGNVPVFPNPLAGGSFLNVNANRQNYYSITAVNNNNQPAKVTTKVLVTLTDVGTGASTSVGSVSFSNQSNIVVPLTIRTPGSYLMRVQDANGNSSQANHNFPGGAYSGPGLDDAPYIQVVPAQQLGFDHFSLRVPAAVLDGTPTNISITPANYRGFPIGGSSAVLIYDTVPDGVQDFLLPADDDPVDGFGILNDATYEPQIFIGRKDPLTAHDALTPSVGFAYEFQYGIADYALTPGYTIGIADDFGTLGTSYPNLFGTGTYPCVFNGVGRHVVIVVDTFSGIATTAVVNVIGRPVIIPSPNVNGILIGR